MANEISGNESRTATHEEDNEGAMETSLDAMRVLCDVIFSELQNHFPHDAESSLSLNERVCVLMKSVAREITDAQDILGRISARKFAV